MPNFKLASLEGVPALGNAEFAEEISKTFEPGGTPKAPWVRYSTGSYRAVFHRPDQPGVVYKAANTHTQYAQANEVNAILDLAATHPEIRHHLPAVYYYVASNGLIVVVMEQIEQVGELGGKEGEMERAVGHYVSDIHPFNFGKRADGTLVVIDLGHTLNYYAAPA